MGYQLSRETNRDWEISRICNFIVRNDLKKEYVPTIEKYIWNFVHHIKKLYDSNQILIYKNDFNEIIGVCGWIRVKKENEYKINKVRWTFPEDILDGENIYITFCTIQGGRALSIKRDLYKMLGNSVNEWCWFTDGRFIRIKNILKRGDL